MSNARKLQTEIDRVMKKVDEGVELFDEIWEKVYTAEQQNQKEKYEMDLKKEIKKLQRLRDQIKTWVGSSDVKDKEPLIEARKLIETKMEQFKICEKETKTKTYSKEGLAREDRLDPLEEAKINTTSWLSEYIERLQQLVEEKDFEIEKFSGGKGKKTNKHQIEELQDHIASHKFHISKLEGIIRLVNNDRLDPELVDNLRDDLDYYIDSHHDEEYVQAYDEEFFYESLGLDEMEVVNVDRVTQASTSSKKSDDATSLSSKEKEDKKNPKKSAIANVIPLTIGRARTTGGKPEVKKEKEEETKAPAATVTPAKVGRANSTGSSHSNGATSTPVPTRAPAPPPLLPATSMAAILKRESEQEKERQQKEQQARLQAEQLRLQQQQQQQQQEAQRQLEAQLRQKEALRQQQEEQQQQQQAQQEALKRQQQEALRLQQEAVAKQQEAAQLQAQHQAVTNHNVPPVQSTIQAQTVQTASSFDMLSSGLGGLNLASGDNRNDAGSVQPPLGVGISQSSSMDSSSTFLSALNDSFITAPGSMDNERSRQYTPQNPYPTPASYPSTPSAIFDNPAVFEKLGTDCLFFIFYYSQGTYQQYLAARELKKQSWRFHKKYMTWFQRHEEPKITTDEYEQGTYVYFDYETGWCTRIKTDFRFEYSYLEDSLQ